VIFAFNAAVVNFAVQLVELFVAHVQGINMIIYYQNIKEVIINTFAVR
jgi:hypothetical protein